MNAAVLPVSPLVFVHHIDDDAAWREQLCRVVAGLTGFACGPLDAARIVVLELWHRGADGFAHAAELKRRPRPPRVLALTHRCDEVALHRSTLGSLDGFLWKTPLASAELREALEELAHRRTYFPAEVLAERQRLCASPEAYFKRLSAVEQELMPFFGRHATDAEIAKRTGRRPETIRWHRSEIMRRLGLHHSTELVLWASVKGHVPPLLPAPPCLHAA